MTVRPSPLILPQPTPEQVAEFRRLCLEHHGKEFTDEEAYDAAMTVLQLVYLATYCGSTPHGEAAGDSETPATPSG